MRDLPQQPLAAPPPPSLLDVLAALPLPELSALFFARLSESDVHSFSQACREAFRLVCEGAPMKAVFVINTWQDDATRDKCARLLWLAHNRRRLERMHVRGVKAQQPAAEAVVLEALHNARNLRELSLWSEGSDAGGG